MLETLSQEIDKKLFKLNNGNYDGLGRHKKFILLCGLMDPFINDLSVKYITEEYMKVSINGGYKRRFDEIWVIWESEDKTKYKIFRLE